MTDKDRPEHDQHREERDFWDAFGESLRSRGINVDQLLAEWAQEEAERLASPGAREDFTELCDDGCNPHVLAALIKLTRASPRLEVIWTTLLGPAENRQKFRRTMENAAAMLEKAFGAVEEDKERGEYARIGRIPPSRMVSELRLYARVISLGESLAARTEAHSLAEVSKYVLCGYIERQSGRPHDRNVSGLIGEITNSPDYNEVAHRMWRNRNYERLEKHFSRITDFLVAMSAVIGRPA
jgi:hypothetical protein